MEKTIKYLENGEYHYATVKDVGDLAKLKTDSKDDLVAAINDLFENGGENAGKPEGYDNLVNNVADAIQKQQQMTDTITNMQQSAQLSDAEMEHMKQVQEELHQEYLKAIKELNKAVEKAKADAAALDKKTNDMQDKIDETFADVNKEVSDVHKQLDAEAKGLHKDLDETKTNLEATRKDLLNSTQEYGQVHSDVQELQDKFNRRVWSTDLDPVREQVSKNSTEVQQTKDELERKADQSNLDLVTNSVENLNTKVKQNASGLEVAVKRDELGGDVARLLGDKTNLLLGTRSFSGEDNWKNRDTVTIEPGYYKGLKSAAVQVLDGSIYQPYRVKADTSYTFSFFAREDKDNPKAKLAIKPIDAKNINIDNEEQVVHITTEWQRFAVTFSVDKECDISIQVIQGPETTNNVLHLAGLKLQYGQNDTPWEPNEADVAENIEHTESQFNVYSDQITGIVKKQEKMGDTERQLDTRITETAEGLKQTSKDLQNANGKITEFKGQLESTAKGLKTEYEKYTNEAIGQISDSSLNLIHNSAFSNRNSDFDQWQNVSAKVNIREDNKQLRWAEITQSGLTSDNPVGLTSNYFSVKQGKVTVAVDIKSGEKATLDNPSVIFIELYDQNKKRVDFQWVNLNDLGLSTEILSDHLVHRGMYRKAIDRADAKYMTVKAHVMRNGDLWFTNFSARLSSIDDGGYTPNPDDVNHQILKMNTKIEEDAEHIALKANSVDVTRDIKSAVQNSNGGGVNLVSGTIEDIVVDDTANTGTQGWRFNTIPINADLKVGDKITVSVENVTMTGKGDLSKWGATLYSTDISECRANNYEVNAGKNAQVTITVNSMKDPNKQTALLIYSGRVSDTEGKKAVFHHLKVERGTVATPWTPASEDTSAEIKSVKDAAIQVASDQINLHVNELSTQFDDKLNKRINKQKTAFEKITSDGIEQTVKKITDVQNDVNNVNSKLDNLQVGTRNLLHHSDTFDSWHKGSSVSISSEKYLGGAVATLNNSGSGGNALCSGLDVTNDEKHITWTVYARADNNGDKLHTELWGGGGLTDQPLTTEWKRYKFAGDHADTYNIFYLWGVNTNKGNIYVALPFAVVGNTIGSWSPNPDDVNQSIKDATEYKEVTGAIDFNDLKAQQKIFYKDVHAQNAPVGGSYWYYLNVEPGTDGRIFQTAISDRDNITWVRTFADGWGSWIRQADQRNIDDLNNQISRFKTETTASVKNLGDRVTTEVNSVTKKINSNNGGGINLQTGTGDCSFPFTANQGQAVVEKYDDHTKMIHAYGSASGFYIGFGNGTFIPDVGEKYTISADIKGKGTIDGNGFKYEGSDSVSTNKVTLSNNWQRISCTVHVSQHTGTWIFYPVPGSGNNDFYVKHIKIERGSVATPWSPAPEDTTDAIKTLNTKLDVANGKIEGKVTETQVNDILNGKGYATQSWAESNFRMKSDSIELEVKKITDPISDKINGVNNRFDNLQVGGRNYLRNSDKTITGWSQDLGTIPNETLNELAGKTITVSCDVEWSGYAHDNSQQNRLGFEASFTGSDGHNYWIGSWKFPNTSSGKERISTQYTLPSGVTFTVNNNGHNGYIGINGSGKVSHVKIEIGNRMTDWTPAPEDINEKIDTQILDSANIDNMRTQGHYFVHNLTGNPIPGWVYVDVTGNNNDRIRQDVYGDQSYVHKFRSWNGSRWTDWEEEVKNTDIITKINMSPEEIKLSSKKIEIDGNTYIHGDLNVQTVKLKGNNGTIDLTGDGIHIGGSKGDIKLDSGGIDITKNGQGLSITGDYIQVVTDSNGQKEITGLIGSNFNLKNKNQNGLALLVTPQQELGRPYGGDLLTIGELEKSGEVTSAVTFDATNITGDGAGFHWTAPHYLHGPAQAIHITETQDNLTLLPLKMPHSSQENYYQPALTVTHGIDGNGNYVHGDSGVEFLWSSIKPYGSVDMTDARLWVYGVDHGIKNVWVSWSNWDGGERYPALVNDIGYWGGIAFPKSGRVTLFDADGRYYTPDRNTGIGAYNNYMGKNDNWH